MIGILIKLLIPFLLCVEAPEEPKAPPQGQPMPWVAHVLRQKDGKKIQRLSLPQLRLPVMLVPQKSDLRPLVEVRLKYDRPGWELFAPNGTKVKKLKNSELFVVFAFLNSQVNELTLIAKSANGDAESEKLYLFAPEVQEFEIVSPWSSIYANVGLGYMTYEQRGFGRLVWKGATIGIGYDTMENSSPWDLHAYVRMSVLSFQTQPVSANPQYINGKLHLSYRLPWLEQTRWRFYGAIGGGY